MKTTNRIFELPQPSKKLQSTDTNSSRSIVLLEGLILLALLGPALLALVAALINLILPLLGGTLGVRFFEYYLPGLAFILALLVALFRNPMHSLLSLIGVFLCIVGVYIASGAMFLGLVFLIVYVGAVAILFLFVVMLLNVKSLTAKKETRLVQHGSQYAAIAALVALAIRLQTGLVPAVELPLAFDTALLSVQESTTAEAVVRYVNQQAGDVFTFRTLYTDHGALFLLITYILLIAMLGAIVLATKTQEDEAPIRGPRQAK